MTSIATFDMKLPNGFRAIAVIPPDALGQPAMAAFVRETAVPAAAQRGRPWEPAVGGVDFAWHPENGSRLRDRFAASTR